MLFASVGFLATLNGGCIRSASRLLGYEYNDVELKKYGMAKKQKEPERSLPSIAYPVIDTKY
jgi:hypothetical protein